LVLLRIAGAIVLCCGARNPFSILACNPADSAPRRASIHASHSFVAAFVFTRDGVSDSRQKRPQTTEGNRHSLDLWQEDRLAGKLYLVRPKAIGHPIAIEFL
jgi:hypothetical protein